MTSSPEIQGNIKKYLLGQLAGEDLAEIERRILTDDEFYEEVRIMEDELVDEYVNAELSPDERRLFEKNFLADPDSRNKLRLGRALDRRLSDQPLRPESKSSESLLLPWTAKLFSSPLRIAAFALIIAAAALGAWRIFFHQSEVDKGLVALNAAYREQRPVEARISQLNYAPYVVTRGPGEEKIDQNQLRLAELTLLEASTKNPTPAVHHALGKVYLAKKDFDKAIEQFDEALKGDPTNAQLYSDLGAAWLEKGKIDLDKGRAEPAGSASGKGMEELGRSLEDLNKAIQLNANLLEALFNRAICRQYLMLPQQAEEDWHEYLKRDSTSAWAEEARRNLQRLEEQKSRKSQTKEQLLQNFLTAYQSKNDGAAWAALSTSRARTGNLIVEALLDDYLFLCQSERSKEAEGKLREISYAGKVEAEQVGDRFTLDLASRYGSANVAARGTLAKARAQMKFATDLYNKSEWQKAIELFTQARDLFAQAHNDAETLFAEAWVGYSYLRIPDPQRGSATFQRLSKIFEARDYKSLFAQSLMAHADSLSSQNEYSRLLDQANHALVVSEQIEDHPNVVRCLLLRTSTYLIFGNYRESLEAAFRALSLADALPPDPKLVWPFYHETSMDFYYLGMPMTALEFEKEALRVATDATLPLQTTRSYDRLGLLSERLHRYDEAIKYSERARAEGQKINDERTRINILAHSALIMGASYRESGDPHRSIALYDQALDLYGRLNLDTYQYQAHKGKLLALMDLNEDGVAELELTTVLFWFERNRQKIAEESYRSSFFDVDHNTYDLAVEFAYSRKGDPLKAFDYAEQSRARSLLELMSSGARVSRQDDSPEIKLSAATSPLSWKQVQQSLPAETQLLEYTVLDDRVIMWVVTRDFLKSADTKIARTELDQKVRDYLGVTARNGSEALAQAKDLYDKLVAPIGGYLNRNLQLTIVPDDSLNFLPFATLVSSNSNRYLIEDYTLETTPSASVFIASTENGTRKGPKISERLLAVGNPSFDRGEFSNLSDLPGAKREVEAIAAAYGTSPLVGEKATAARVKEGLKENDIVHLATHALPDEKSPLLSKLLLAADRGEAHHANSGSLRASEVYELKLPRTRLVVLSACQTGIERSYRGEGAIGLARPFLSAGVPIVIASLWPVESEATANLMISFHKHRKQDHLSTVEALRRAQLETLHHLQSNSQTSYDWAAFIAIGGYAVY